jgi:DNA-directed RNA polymerase subunit RPC12/RpoP
MKICINCDAKNDETSNYCTSCGSKLIIDKVDSAANNISEKIIDIKIPIEVKSGTIQSIKKKQKKIYHYLSNINTYIYLGVFSIIFLLFFLNSSSNKVDKKEINSSNNSYQNTLKEKANVIDFNIKSDNCLQEKLYIEEKLDDILSNVKDIKDVYYRYRSDDNY